MKPTAARASVLALSFVVLAVSGAVTTVVWSFLSPLQALPRALASLLVFVSAYYAGANLLFWRAVVRISAPRPARQA